MSHGCSWIEYRIRDIAKKAIAALELKAAATHGATWDHGSELTGLTDDDHSQYALLAGRSGGQTLKGDTASGGNLTLQSTAHGTKGKVIVGTIALDEANVRIGIGTTSPSFGLDMGSVVADNRIVLYDAGGGGCYGFGIAAGQLRIGVASNGDVNSFGTRHGGSWLTWAQSSQDAFTLFGMPLVIKEQNTPSTPASGYGAFFVKNDNHAYFLDDAGTETPLTKGPQWHTYTLSVGVELTAASTNQTGTLFSLPAGAVVHAVIFYESTAFTTKKGTISAINFKLGISGNDVKYHSQKDMMTAGPYQDCEFNQGMESMTGATNIIWTCDTIGGNINTIADGAIQMRVLWSRSG